MEPTKTFCNFLHMSAEGKWITLSWISFSQKLGKAAQRVKALLLSSSLVMTFGLQIND